MSGFEPPQGYEGDAGSKGDAGKARTELLPFGALLEVAQVFTFGAEKYGSYNWYGLSCSRLFAASLRHLWAWWRGEDNDPETGRSHLAHAACCVLMVLEQVLDRPRYDDRPSAEPEREPTQWRTQRGEKLRSERWDNETTIYGLPGETVRTLIYEARMDGRLQ